MPDSATAHSFDAIVIGAGAAGVCCAGELVLAGLRPLLVAEAQDVGYQFRAMAMENGRPPQQFPTRNLYGEGGWWYSLAQRLNVDFTARRVLGGLGSTVLGSGIVSEHRPITSATALATSLAARAPEPLGSAFDDLVRVLHLGLTMPAERLADLHSTPLAEWLDDLKVDEAVRTLTIGMVAGSSYLPKAQAEEFASVFGAFTRLRNYLFGHAELCSVEPNARDGVFRPMGRAIEGHGGVVWRGRKVARVRREHDRAVGIVMDDGTEAKAPMTAVAAATSRLSSLFDDTLPPEVGAVRSFEESLGNYREYVAVTIIDRHLFPPGYVGINSLRADGSRIQADFSMAAAAPWSTREGWEVVVSELVRSTDEVDADGGPTALFTGMQTVTESLLPGFGDAIVERRTDSHPQFISSFLCGPKLPRVSPSTPGLWYVGEGSVPVDGVYTDGAASAGVLGAREMIRWSGQNPRR